MKGWPYFGEVMAARVLVGINSAIVVASLRFPMLLEFFAPACVPSF